MEVAKQFNKPFEAELKDLKKRHKDCDDKIDQMYSKKGRDFFKSQEFKNLVQEKGTIKQEIEKLEKRLIRPFANMIMYSDVLPYEVVEVVSDQTVKVRGMDAKQTKFPEKIHMGGFLAHFEDNHNQDYEYSSIKDAPIQTIRWSKAKSMWQAEGQKFSMNEKPIRFYDYNF